MLAHLEGARRVNGHVAHLHHGASLIGIGGADIDKQVLDGRGAVVLRRLAAQHALHAVFKHNAAELALLHADAAHVGYAQEALFFDGGDHQADMVHMRGQHDALGVVIAAVLFNDQVAQGIRAHAVHVPAQHLFDDGRYIVLAAGGAPGTQQGFQCIA